MGDFFGTILRDTDEKLNSHCRDLTLQRSYKFVRLMDSYIDLTDWHSRKQGGPNNEKFFVLNGFDL